MSEAVASPGLTRLLARLNGLTVAETAAAPDPEVAWETAFAAGHAEGLAEAAGELAPLRRQLQEAAKGLAAAAQIDADALRPVFTLLVERLCGAALAAELRLSPEALRPLVDASVAAASGQGTRLRLHPASLAALDLPDLAVAVEADPGLALDEVAIDGPAFALETSLSARLAAIVAALP